MTSTPERRKHSACLLRIRENCPFRKLRKNKCSGNCYVIQRYVTRCVYSLCKVSSSSEAAGRRWGNCQAICAEIYPQALSYQPFYHHQHHHPENLQQQEGDHSAMEAEVAPSITGPPLSSFSEGTYTGSVSSSSNLMRLHQSSLSTSDPSMELDSGVDPETGERAQG